MNVRRVAAPALGLLLVAGVQQTVQIRSAGVQTLSGSAPLPDLRFGRSAATAPLGESSHPNAGGHIDLGLNFDEPPVFLASIDESFSGFGGPNGGVFAKLTRVRDNRVSVGVNAPVDGLDWMAIAEGVHEISGKTVVSGRESITSSVTDIPLPQLFASPPIVLVFAEESSLGTMAWARVIRVEQDRFDVQLNAAASVVHWVALEPGEYRSGPYRWTAGQFSGLLPIAERTFPQAFDSLPGFITTIYDTSGSGATWCRMTDQDNASVDLELNGVTEFVNWVAFEIDR